MFKVHWNLTYTSINSASGIQKHMIRGNVRPRWGREFLSRSCFQQTYDSSGVRLLNAEMVFYPAGLDVFKNCDFRSVSDLNVVEWYRITTMLRPTTPAGSYLYRISNSGRFPTPAGSHVYRNGDFKLVSDPGGVECFFIPTYGIRVSPLALTKGISSSKNLLIPFKHLLSFL